MQCEKRLSRDGFTAAVQSFGLINSDMALPRIAGQPFFKQIEHTKRQCEDSSQNYYSSSNPTEYSDKHVCQYVYLTPKRAKSS